MQISLPKIHIQSQIFLQSPNQLSSRSALHKQLISPQQSQKPTVPQRNNMSAVLEPACASIPASGGSSTHQLINQGTERLAFKVKSSNNDHYRVNPVYGFVEPGASSAIEITRLVSP